MFYKPTSRLFVVKFLGLFGSAQPQFSVNDSAGGDAQKDDKIEARVKRTCDKRQPECDKQYGDAKNNSSRQVTGILLEKGIPGLTICVAKKGQVVWHSAFGFCDVENQLECRPEARMRIASISKPLFVSTIVGPLLDENRIDIKASVHKYLTEQEFPKQKYNDKEVDVTIEQLMAHTSGIRHYDEGREPDKPLRPIGSNGSEKIHQCNDQFNRKGFFQRQTFRSVVEALEPFKNEPLLSEPGTKYSYTTYGYTLLSAVIEKIAGQSNGRSDNKEKYDQIEDFWMRTLRRDWKLEETSLDQDEPILSNRARYYLRTGRNGNLVNAPYTDSSVKWAGGGIVSTTRDLVKFGNLLIDSYKGKKDARLKSETIKKLWTEVKSSYGLGFQIYKMDADKSQVEKNAVFHLGGALGASSALILYPESEVVVAILTNLGEVNLKSLGLFVAEQFAKAE